MFSKSVPGISTKFDGSLDIIVEGLEDLRINHIIEVGVSTRVISTEPPVIQVAVHPAKKTTAAVASIVAQAQAQDQAPTTVAEEKRCARHLAASWYVQDLEFSHYQRESKLGHKVAVYTATAARRFEAVKTDIGWTVKPGGQIRRPTTHNELLLAKVYADA